MMASLAIGTARELLLSHASGISSACADVVRAVLTEGDSAEVEVTFPVAFEVLDTYQYRCQAIDGFRESRFGWEEFFFSLSGIEGRVALLSILAGGWRLLVLLDESTNRALACLCRPPD